MISSRIEALLIIDESVVSSLPLVNLPLAGVGMIFF